MVWGILGLFFAGPILGLIAVALASQAHKAIARKPGTYGGKGMADAGMVLGIIDIITWGLIVFYFI